MLTHISIPERVEVVVLDLDGTIYRKPWMAWYMLLKQWRHLPSLIAERRWRKAQRKALQSSNLPIFQSSNSAQPFDEHWYRQDYLPSMVQIIAEHYQPAPWLQPLLDECRLRKIQVLILSDYEAAADKLHALGVDPTAFDAILSTGDFGTIKPDPRLGDVLRSAIKNAAINWQHVLFIGDRPDTDGQLAQALGAQFILVQPS